MKFVSGNPGKTAMLLLPRHHLVDEQIAALHAEHPDKPFRAAIWRGMHREDPEFIGPQRPGEEKLMCWRDKEARALEEAVISVKDNLCKKGRGKKQVRCPFFELCGCNGRENCGRHLARRAGTAGAREAEGVRRCRTDLYRREPARRDDVRT